MSYSRSFSKTISVYYSGTASTTVSVGGQSRSVSVPYSGYAQEVVTVRVHVDTDPFDYSVGKCNNNVNLLTGAVVATESAQIASIRDNSRKVAQTIINGFFKTVRSEISQQIVELKSRIDATLLHLHELSKRCVEKQVQMEKDYNMITSRYSKVFTDLDNELSNRIHELDRPAFVFRKTSGECVSPVMDSDMVTTVAVSGLEQSSLEAKISASVAKKTALDAIMKANRFLEINQKTDSILDKCILPMEGEASYYAPVCYMESSDNQEKSMKRIYSQERLPEMDKDQFVEKIGSAEWPRPDEATVSRLRKCFNAEVNAHYSNSSAPHDVRVSEYINRLFDINSIQMF
ncbi:MAG: hypothetical protein IAC08_02335 [Bacteroidetes bacterium]|uniref:Uncharacterized protein n=1 Tax=Candidatus Cryptobacteroides intestinigallinarum TaxID=2840767 RepID=A0A9D9HJZ7_9BACT|nr:hypothetical protein [Candidatus Cryptobacteroides intestinigallinarum]